MNASTRQKFYRRFDAPTPRANSFTRRVVTATRWLTNAGMVRQIERTLKDAEEFAGSNEQDYLAFVAWRIRAYQVAHGGK